MHVETAAPSASSLVDENSPLLDRDELSQDSLESPVSEPWVQKLKPLSIFFLMSVYALLVWSTWNYLNTRLGFPNTAPTNGFSLEYVETVLRNITQKPHMYNSDENLRVRDYLVRELQTIAANSKNKIQVWDDDSTNVVVNNNFFESSNIVVRIRGNASRDSALLVSAHYDSTSLSHGVTDDGIAVSVMLEVIRLIGNSTLPQMDVIFNINNGEEMGLLGGYAFLLHPWFKHIKAFINLEGTGAAIGTRSVLFRTNSFEVAKLCEAAPYPHASIIFNELMKYVKSDTDYRPYSAIASLPGIDIAFYSYRYLYHTPHDNIENYKSHSALQMGLNLAAMVRKAVDAPEWLHKLPPVPAEEDPLGVLSTPEFVYYDLYGYYFVIFKGLSFVTWQGILIFACILLALGSALVSYISTGSLSIWDDRLKPFLREYLFVLFAFFSALLICFFFSVAKWMINPSSSYGQYKLNIVWISAAIVAAFSFSCLLWPKVERIIGMSEGPYQPIVLPESISDEDFLPSQDTRSLPDYLFVHRGLLGFWCTLLFFSWVLTMTLKISSLYFVYDWTFSSLISVVVLYNLPTVVEFDLGPSAIPEGFWNSSKKNLLSNLWIIGMIISMSFPSLKTMDIILALMIGLPSLIAEGLSSIVVDMAFGFLITILLINILPGIRSTKAIFFSLLSCAVLIPSFLVNVWIFPFSPNTPQKFMFTHTWDITSNNSEVELMVSPTMNSAAFIKVSRDWTSYLASPNCTSHADKRDSTSCLYAAPHPELRGTLSGLDPHSLITLHWKKDGFDTNDESLRDHGEFIAAKWMGSPESRICSIQIFRDSIDPISVELDVHSNADWVSIPDFPSPSVNLSEPIYLMKRSFGPNRRIESTLLIKGSVSGLERLKIRCYHSEVAGNIKSTFFEDLDQKKPSWTSFHHGRMGGIILEKTFKFQLSNQE